MIKELMAANGCCDAVAPTEDLFGFALEAASDGDESDVSDEVANHT